MIKYTTGDILAADAEALVNTVNCVGIMGRGIALQFKDAFPGNFRVYEAACKRHELRPGRMLVFETGSMTNPKYIINFPTKRHWRGKSRLEDIEVGLTALVDEIKRRRIHSIAIPPLGSGLGGLYWPDVKARIEDALAGVANVDVAVYEPVYTPSKVVKTRLRDVPRMTPGRAALVVLMHQYLAGLLDPFVSLLEVHKLMYFMQEAGEPLKLRYEKGLYGPYATNLRHVLQAIEGQLVSGYTDDDSPTKPLELVPGAVDDALGFIKSDASTNTRLERVSQLVEGFESPHGLELLATVHWVASREEAESAEQVVRHVYDWGDRKKQFTRRQIELALDVLHSKGWLDK